MHETIPHDSALDGRFAELPETVRADFSALLHHVLPQAVEELIRADGFVPFAAAQTAEGPTDVTPSDIAEAEEDGRVMELLQTTLRKGAISAGHRATVQVWDAIAAPKHGGKAVETIVALLDHREGASATAYVPYTPNELGVELSQVHIEEGAGVIFPAQMA